MTTASRSLEIWRRKHEPDANGTTMRPFRSKWYRYKAYDMFCLSIYLNIGNFDLVYFREFHSPLRAASCESNPPKRGREGGRQKKRERVREGREREGEGRGGRQNKREKE